MSDDSGAKDLQTGSSPSPAVVGWREWVVLPDLGGARIKAKVDTGALTSALHVFDLEEFDDGGLHKARFEIHPAQRSRGDAISVVYEIIEHREVRSSSGQSQIRPLIKTNLSLGGQVWPIEVTLTSRDQMGFRMLLGRRALRRRFLVDPAKSFLVGKRPVVQKEQQVAG